MLAALRFVSNRDCSRAWVPLTSLPLSHCNFLLGMEVHIVDILARLANIDDDLQRVRADNLEAVEQLTRRLESLEVGIGSEIRCKSVKKLEAGFGEIFYIWSGSLIKWRDLCSQSPPPPPR
jgi:hypothetical protein